MGMNQSTSGFLSILILSHSDKEILNLRELNNLLGQYPNVREIEIRERNFLKVRSLYIL